jgi:ribosomal protein S18 acetylase RimI-like enzyme
MNPHIKIRPAAPEDWPAIKLSLTYMATLHNGLRPDLYTLKPKLVYGQYRKLTKNPEKTPVLVAVDEENHILGHLFAEYRHIKKHGCNQARSYLYVGDLCVDESARGQGIGARLLEEAALLARLRGLDKLELNVTEANENTLRFYENRGFCTQKRVMEKFVGES